MKAQLGQICLLSAFAFVAGQAVYAQGTGPQGSTQTPLVLPGNGVNLNPIGAPGSRLLNNTQQPTTAPLNTTLNGSPLPGLNFGTGAIGRLSPPAGTSGVSGIGRLGPPGGGPNLTVSPNLSGPPTGSPAGTISPITNSSASISSGSSGGGGGAQGGPITASNAPPVNPTNPGSNNFQVNPTGSSGLRNPSNNYRP